MYDKNSSYGKEIQKQKLILELETPFTLLI